MSFTRKTLGVHSIEIVLVVRQSIMQQSGKDARGMIVTTLHVLSVITGVVAF